VPGRPPGSARGTAGLFGGKEKGVIEERVGVGIGRRGQPVPRLSVDLRRGVDDLGCELRRHLGEEPFEHDLVGGPQRGARGLLGRDRP